MKQTYGKAVVVCKDKRAGILVRDASEYTFTYEDAYFNDPESFPISLSLP